MINWLVRIKNKNFWFFIIPICALLIEEVLSIFGVVIDLGDIGNRLKHIVELLFLILGALGIVNDPTTDGLGDSQQALNYTVPKK